jgi:hypothetical protein
LMLCSLVGLVQQCYEICVCRGVASWCSFTVLLTAASGTVTVSAPALSITGSVASRTGPSVISGGADVLVLPVRLLLLAPYHPCGCWCS